MITGASSFDTHFQRVKNSVDLQPQDFRQSMDHKSFSEFCSHIKDKVFLSAEFDSQPLWKRTEALWLQMAFSLFVRHHAQGNIRDTVQKLQALNELDMALIEKVRQIIRDINYMADDSYRDKSINFHQKALHIHWNLLRYFQAFAASLPAETLLRAPLGLDPEKLAISQAKAKNEREKNENAKLTAVSQPELEANQTIRSALQAGTRIASLKTSSQHCFVDEETGLELDCPLSSKLSVETDGEKGHVKNGTHGLIHTLKALAFRESGGQRIPIDISPQLIQRNGHMQIARVYGELLNNQSIIDFLQLTDHLNVMRRELRSKLKEIQQQYFHYTKMSVEYKSAIEKHFSTLLKLENNLRLFANQKTLEKLFLEMQSSLINPQMRIEFINQYRNVCQTIESLLNKSDNVKGLLAKLEESKARNSNVVSEICVEIEKVTFLTENLEQRYREESARHTRHLAVYEQALGQKNTRVIQGESKFIKEITQVLATLKTKIDEAKLQNEAFSESLRSRVEQVKRDSAEIETLQEEITKVEVMIANSEAEKQRILRTALHTDQLQQLLTNHQSTLVVVEEQYKTTMSTLFTKENAIKEAKLYAPQYSRASEVKRGSSHLSQERSKVLRESERHNSVHRADFRRERVSGTSS